MNKLKYIIGGMLLLLAAGCEKDTEPTNFAPKLSTGEASVITRTSAVISGTIQKQSSVVKEFGFIYSKSSSLSDNEATHIRIPDETQASFSATLQDLEDGTTYYYCTYANSGYTTVKGGVKQFSTVSSVVPSLGVTELVGKQEETSLTVGSKLIEDGGAPVSLIGFCYIEKSAGKDPVETDKVVNVTLSGGQAEFNATIRELKAGTTYLIRSYASNRKGTGYGQILEVATADDESPKLKTSEVGNCGGSWADAVGELVSEGASAVVEKGFCWTTDSSVEPVYTDVNNRLIVSGERLSGKITGLKGSTQYYMRAYARNSTRVAYGNTVTFTTSSLTVPVLSQPVISDIQAYTAVAKASITNNGNGIITETGYCISELSEPAERTPVDAVNNEFAVNLSGLKHSTSYYIRFYAVNEAGIAYGPAIRFTMLQVAPPSLGELLISDVTPNEMKCTAEVTGMNNGTVIRRGFCYSATNPSPTMENSADKFIEVGADEDFVAVLSGLLANTTYYICAFAENEEGFGYSSVQSQKTAPSTEPGEGDVEIPDIKD